MKKRNSRFGELVGWTIGGILFYKMFLKESSPVVGQTETNKEKVFKHIKKEEIEYVYTYPKNFFGYTEIKVKFDFEVKKNLDGFYKAKITKFIVTSRRLINGNKNVFNHISQFKYYYKPNRNYTYFDYEPSFNTKEGTEYHEKLHQDEMDIVLFKDFQPVIENEIALISFLNKKDAEDKARYILNFYKNFLESKNDRLEESEKSKKRHEQIELKEWEWLHDHYVIWKGRNGK